MLYISNTVQILLTFSEVVFNSNGYVSSCIGNVQIFMEKGSELR